MPKALQVGLSALERGQYGWPEFVRLRAWLGIPGTRGTGLLGSLDPVSSEMLVYGSGSSGSSQMLIHGDASTRGGSVSCVASYCSYSAPQASFEHKLKCRS